MQNQKTLALLLIIAGLILFFVSIYAFPLGIARNESFGAFQWGGTIIGALVVLFGIVQLKKSRKSEPPADQ